MSALLSGGYLYETDLIGNKAAAIISFDSIIIDRGSVYYMIPSGTGHKICTLESKNQKWSDCPLGKDVKLERTLLGNYIIQVAGANDNYQYGLWMRGEKADSSKLSACILWVGDGIVGASSHSPFDSTRRLNSNNPAFIDITNELEKISSDESINRNQLLKIVAVYEKHIHQFEGAVSCLNDRTRINGQQIVIAKDNRHLRDIE
jgi:hypothetical protein